MKTLPVAVAERAYQRLKLGETFPSLGRRRWPILNLGMFFSAKWNIRINPPCNSPVQFSRLWSGCNRPMCRAARRSEEFTDENR
jgi:hypothetical protein